MATSDDFRRTRFLAGSGAPRLTSSCMKKVLLLVLALLFSSRTNAQGIRNFTDDDYKKVLGKESRVLFYSFSPSMPLSVEGLKEVRHAARALHATLVTLADPAANQSEILSLGDPEIRYQKSGRLRDQGIQLHYPSVVVSNNHKVVGPPIEGYKTHAGYVTLVSDLLKLSWKEEFQGVSAWSRRISLRRSV